MFILAKEHEKMELMKVSKWLHAADIDFIVRIEFTLAKPIAKRKNQPPNNNSWNTFNNNNVR